MATETIEIQKATSRLQQYNDVLAKKKDSILEEVAFADAASEKPIDKKKYLMQYVDYCICKVYGVKAPAYRKGQPRLFDKGNKYAGSLYLYFYWKLMDESYRKMAENLGSNRTDVGRRIQSIIDEANTSDLAKQKYIQTQINNFIEFI